MTLGLLLGAILLVVGAAAYYQQQDLKKKCAVLRWVDEREKLQIKLMGQISDLRALGAVPHIGQIDGVRTQRFGPNGPTTFAPSDTGLKQLALAMNILAERENLYQQMRDGIMKTYGQLVNWEREHPVPDVGIPYDLPPRPVKMPEKQYPNNDTKPVPRAFLDAPIYNKELTS